MFKSIWMFILYFARLPVMFASRKLLTLESKNKQAYFVLCSLTRNFAGDFQYGDYE